MCFVGVIFQLALSAILPMACPCELLDGLHGGDYVGIETGTCTWQGPGPAPPGLAAGSNVLGTSARGAAQG